MLVLTVDPARRLATALGLEAFGNTPYAIPNDALEAAGLEPRGELHVAMLDTKAGWDDLIRRHAPDAATREAVLANPLYENITSRFVHSHDYLAMEQLHDLHATGDYDLVIVDTPPSRNALHDPRCAEPDGRLLRESTAALADGAVPVPAVHVRVEAVLPSGRSRARLTLPRRTSPTSSCCSRRWRRVSCRRAHEVEALLVDPRTAFVVVSTLETAPAHEARYLAESLRDAQDGRRGDRRQPGAARRASRRVTPRRPRSDIAGRTRAGTDDELVTALAARTGDDPVIGRNESCTDGDALRRPGDGGRARGRSPCRTRRVGDRRRSTVPWLSGDIHDLAGLGRLACHLRGRRRSGRLIVMTSLVDLCRAHSSLDRDDIDHLHRLDGGVGVPRRPVLRRPAAARPVRRRRVADRRSGASGHEPDDVRRSTSSASGRRRPKPS